jgi:hypothetical protein
MHWTRDAARISGLSPPPPRLGGVRHRSGRRRDSLAKWPEAERMGTPGKGRCLWGSLASCGRLAIGQLARWRETAAVGNRRAGCQPAPRHRHRFHCYVAHPRLGQEIHLHSRMQYNQLPTWRSETIRGQYGYSRSRQRHNRQTLVQPGGGLGDGGTIAGCGDCATEAGGEPDPDEGGSTGAAVRQSRNQSKPGRTVGRRPGGFLARSGGMAICPRGEPFKD